MAVWSAAGSAIGNIAGNLLQQSSQSTQADAARSWQETMRRTAYQTTVKDMEAAGLNPMLAYSQGASQTPGAAMASITGTMGSAVSDAVAAYHTGKQNEQIDAAIRNTQADTKVKESQAKVNSASADSIEAVSDAQVAKAEAEIPNISTDTGYKASLTNSQIMGLSKLKQEIANLKQMNPNIAADTLSKIISNRLKELDINEAQAYSSFYGSGAGKAAPYIELGGKVINSAAKVRHSK